jgi:S1-C subfamily serine protease
MLAVCVCSALALGASSRKLEKVVLRDGTEYRGVKLNRREGDRVVVFHSRGIVEIPLTQLPDEALEAWRLPSHADLKAREASARARGLVQYEGKWVTPDEKLELEANAKAMEIIGRKSMRFSRYKVVKPFSDGSICVQLRRSRTYGEVPTGKPFFLYGLTNATTTDWEDKVTRLYYAGTLTFRDEQGIPTTIPSYAIDKETAIQVVKRKYGLLPPKGDAPDGHFPPGVKTSGTGFVITDEGHILTNAHVVDEAKRILVRSEKGRHEAKVLAKDKEVDLALLQVDADLPPLAFTGAESERLGATVFTVGFPRPTIQGFSPKMTRGDVSGMKGMFDSDLHYQVSVPLQPGNSGGPLADVRGDVVGVVVMTLRDDTMMMATGSLAENVNYAIKRRHVMAFLDRAPGVKKKLAKSADPAAAPPPFVDAVGKVQDSAVLILVY